jgi:hypothetical protein
MTFEEFDKFQAALFADCRMITETKGREYAHSKERFANFTRIANELEISPEMVAWIYLKKHLDSIISMITGEFTGVESRHSRFVDAVTYLSLLEGMLEEKEKFYAASGYSTHKGLEE